jgi:hypothetical protein
MAAFPPEADKSATMAQGHIIVTVVSTVVARVQGSINVDMQNTYEEYTLFDASSVEKRSSFILRRYANGDCEITTDSMVATSGLIGTGLAVTIEQQYPASSPKAGFKMAATTCLVQVSYTLNARGAASQMKWSIKPYGAAVPWTITPAQAYA